MTLADFQTNQEERLQVKSVHMGGLLVLVSFKHKI